MYLLKKIQVKVDSCSSNPCYSKVNDTSETISKKAFCESSSNVKLRFRSLNSLDQMYSFRLPKHWIQFLNWEIDSCSIILVSLTPRRMPGSLKVSLLFDFLFVFILMQKSPSDQPITTITLLQWPFYANVMMFPLP